jgi:HD superfamily phosphohydrolase
MQSKANTLLASLMSGQMESIRDPLWKDIHLSQQLKRVSSVPCVQKLGRIKQLGPTFHLYPGAVHTRLGHSVGVYHVSSQILIGLLKQAKARTMDIPFTEEGMKTFLCASLLHDIGHFPYAHSLKELPLRSHEEIAGILIEGDEQLRRAIIDAGLDPAMVAAIIDEHRPTQDSEIALYRSLLSGTLDPDKLDYLNRDAFFCGVPYGMQDVSYITDKLVVAGQKVALLEQALPSVEHLLFSKYLMYRNVYWHKTTRSATAMIKKAVLLSLSTKNLNAEQLYTLDDEQFSLLGQEISPLFAMVRDNQLYPCRFEQSFESGSELERNTLGLAERTQFEEELAGRLGVPEHHVIIDIPEPISFESDIPVLTEGGKLSSFALLDQVFSHDIGRVFTKSLRKFRIFTHPSIKAKDLEEVLEF